MKPTVRSALRRLRAQDSLRENPAAPVSEAEVTAAIAAITSDTAQHRGTRTMAPEQTGTAEHEVRRGTRTMGPDQARYSQHPNRLGTRTMGPHQDQPRRVPRAVQLVGAAAALAAVALVVPGLVSSPVIATPPLLTYEAVTGPTATELAMKLAEAARTQPGAAPGEDVTYTRLQSWIISNQTATTGEVFDSDAHALTREIWRDESGRGLIVDTIEDRKVDQFQVEGDQETAWLGLTADANAAAGVIAERGREPFHTFVYLGDVYKSGLRVEPDVQAALLTALAGTPDLELLGRTQDREGRDGLAIATTADYGDVVEKHVLIFDEDTGALLSYEVIALTESPEFTIEPPATLSYTLWEDRRNFDELP